MLVRKGRLAFAVAALLAIQLAPARAETLELGIVSVEDGDSITAVREGKKLRVRLLSIDAPERGQYFAEEARKGLAHAILDQTVRLEIEEYDSDGLALARIYLGQTDLNLELVRAGLAWHDHRHSSEKALIEAHAEARKAGRGLWAGVSRIPPWEFRDALRNRPDDDQ